MGRIEQKIAGIRRRSGARPRRLRGESGAGRARRSDGAGIGVALGDPGRSEGGRGPRPRGRGHREDLGEGRRQDNRGPRRGRDELTLATNPTTGYDWQVDRIDRPSVSRRSKPAGDSPDAASPPAPRPP